MLVIQGDPTERAKLSAMLTSAGHEVETAATAITGRLVARASRPDLVLLALELADERGASLCRALRADPMTSGALLCVLTNSDAEADRVEAFEAGADDVVTRPYSKRELMLRVSVLLRRRRRAVTSPRVLVRVGPIAIDPAARRVRVEDRDVVLTRREFDVLLVLAEGAGRVYTREALMARAWPDEVDSGRVVDTTMKRLRKKLGPAARLVQTVRGAGYRFGASDDSQGREGS